MRQVLALLALLSCQFPVLAMEEGCAPADLLAGEPAGTDGNGTNHSDGSGPLTVVSLNMAGETDWETVRAGFESVAEAPQADIYLLQEFVRDPCDLLGTISAAWGYHYMFSGTERCGQGCLKGVAILSRFPLRQQKLLELPKNKLKVHQRCRLALGATVETRLGAVRIYSLHLDTRINSGRRVRQLGPIFDQVAEIDGPILIGGDFNTANILYIQSVFPVPFLQRQGNAVGKAMRKRGFQTPFRETGSTFKFPPAKLDWIFLKGLDASRRGVAGIRFSDHRALWVQLEKGK